MKKYNKDDKQIVFIWNSYGDTKVYAMNTIDDYKSLYKRIADVLEQSGYVHRPKRRTLNIDDLTKTIMSIETHLEKHPDSIRAHYSCIREIMMNVDRSDMFDYGTELSTLSYLN